MMNNEDYIEQYKKLMQEEENKELSNNSILIECFINYCESKNISLTKKDFKYVQTIGVIAKYPNLVYLLNNDVQMDKEELVSMELLDKVFERKHFCSGYFYSNKYIALAHPYFRRGYHEDSNFAPKFIEVFLNKIDIKNKNFLALDFDRVRINVDEDMYMEADTWFGASFNENISVIEDGIVKLRPPQDLETRIIDFLFHKTYSLDIKWKTKDGIRIFEAEEFKTDECLITKNGKQYYPVKYLHAEYDSKHGFFRHFDGAIHFYTKEEYYSRRVSDFNYNQKNDKKLKTLSQKLFKINGEINVNDWVELSSHFLTGNPLIIEYFEGELPTKTREIIEAQRNYKNK